MARYYVHEDDNTTHVLEGVEAIAHYLRQHPHADGHIYFNERFRIKFDTQTGDVNHVYIPSEEEKNNAVNVVFTSSFDNILLPIKEAMRILAVYWLLTELANLDPEIENLLRKKHRKGDDLVNFNRLAIEDTLEEVVRMVTPKEQSFFDHLFSHDLNADQLKLRETIYSALRKKIAALCSKNHVEEIMKFIRKKHPA